MKKLIDKEKVISEIKRRIEILEDNINKPDTLQFLKSALKYEVERYESLITYIDTIETTDNSLENLMLELPESIADQKNHQVYQLSIYHYDRNCCVDYVGELDHDSLVCFAESTFTEAVSKMKNWIQENKIDKHLQIPDDCETTHQEQEKTSSDELDNYMMNANAADIEVKKGKSYICVEDWKKRGTSFTKGKIYVCHKDRCMYDDFGAEKASVGKLFRLATKEEIKTSRFFTKGDWVVLYIEGNGSITTQIKDVEVTSDKETRYWISDNKLNIRWFDDKSTARRWNINFDAKDGDILCTYECGEPKIVFILKGTPKKHYALSYYCYYNIMYPHFNPGIEKGCLAPNDEDVKPATKEQQDTLFAKMKESGYELDGNTKKLMEIEQKQVIDYPDSLPKDNWEFIHEFVEKFGRMPKDEDELNILVKYVLKKQKPAEWSDEDERIYQSIMDDTVQENQLSSEQTNWLRDIKYRYFPQPKQEWSDEDERICQCLIRDQKEALDNVRNDKYGHSEIISDLKEMYNERIDWLKSLKQRMKGE